MSEEDSSSDDEPPCPPPDMDAPLPPDVAPPKPPPSPPSPNPPKSINQLPLISSELPPSEAIITDDSDEYYSDSDLEDTDDSAAPPPPAEEPVYPDETRRPTSPSMGALRTFQELTSTQPSLSKSSSNRKNPSPMVKVLARKYEKNGVPMGMRPGSLEKKDSPSSNKNAPESQNNIMSPNSHRPSGFFNKKKTQCAAPSCFSFTMRETTMCLRHMYMMFYKPSEKYRTKQFQVANEIVQTEKSFLKGLKIGTDMFMKPLQARVELEKPIISSADIALIFNNLEDIYSLSKKLYDDLEEIRAKKEIFVYQIGLTLLHYAPYFRPYQQYLEGYDTAVRRMIEVRKSNSDFKLFCQMQERAIGITLESALIMPVQRLPRYLLLLNELKKQTKDIVEEGQTNPHEDPESLRKDLTEAHGNIQRIAAAINDSLRLGNRAKEIKEIAAQFEKDDRYMDLEKPGRVLIRHGILMKAFSKASKHMGKYKKYHFFLFNDVIIYADEQRTATGQKRYKMKHVLYLDQFIVVKDVEKANNRIKFIVAKQTKTTDQSKNFLLKAQNRIERDQWYKDLDKAIKDLKAPAPLAVENFDGRRSSQKGSSSKMAALLGMA